MVVAADEFRRSEETRADLAAFLLSAPDFDLLDLERLPRLPRVAALPE